LLRTPLTIVSVLAWPLWSAAAQSAELSIPYLTPAPASGWIISIGGTATARPKYEGASTFGFSGAPSLSWRRVGETRAFSAPDDGIGLALFDNKTFRVGPVGRFRAGRYSGSDAELGGLRDVPWTIEAGLFVEFWPIIDRLRTRLEVRQGFTAIAALSPISRPTGSKPSAPSPCRADLGCRSATAPSPLRTLASFRRRRRAMVA